MKDILEFLSSRLVLLPCLREFFIFFGGGDVGSVESCRGVGEIG